ncbi:hypothetical protein MAR_000519, partial [Mya arenaria]
MLFLMFVKDIEQYLPENSDAYAAVIFSDNGGNNNENVNLYYSYELIEKVKSFNYHGIVLSSGVLFMNATQTLADKGLKAMGN